jgi:hypothetical protein
MRTYSTPIVTKQVMYVNTTKDTNTMRAVCDKSPVSSATPHISVVKVTFTFVTLENLVYLPVAVPNTAGAGAANTRPRITAPVHSPLAAFMERWRVGFVSLQNLSKATAVKVRSKHNMPAVST